LVPVEIHRFLLGLDTPLEFRDWLYQHVDEVERSLPRTDFLALLELDFDDRPAVVELASWLRKRVLPISPTGDAERTDYLVMGDELQAQGDPRGELIMLQASLLDSGHQVLSEAALLDEHRQQLLGPLVRFVETGWLQVEWFLGFIVRARLQEGTSAELGAVARALLEHPSGSRLRSLEVTARGDWGLKHGFQAVLAALRAPSRLTTLILETGEESFYPGIGDLGSVFSAQDSLRMVEANGTRAELGPVPLDLMSLVLRTGNLSKTAVAALASGVAPSLERLELWLEEDSDVAGSDLGQLLRRKRFPRLRHLSLPGALGEDVLDALVSSDVTPQLRSLDLSRGAGAGQAAQIIIDHAKSLSHLHRLDLRWNRIPAQLAREVARLLPQALTGDQGEADWNRIGVRRLDLRGDPWW
jgi:hypothetical protein